ncbi:hypothetical protein FIBSPDRAFT_858276 [Athelia psychrophila]|uniref:Uncharacterized protein n=1 Tax=Athelia psychrophila TaxID=1759441 RepID=A0A166M6F7_9AGAM|nr:hypothetical protein FIBSPDRAFT_858276 [Fibularhizoctonia sp. CBS 109695]
MATNTNTALMSADVEYMVRRGMTKGYQLLSVLTPPLYTALFLTRRGRAHFSINRLLRATWLGGAAGCAGGGVYEYARSSMSTETTIRARRMNAAYNTSSLRADDHATIGAVLFAVLNPALFWSRARVAHLVLGGAGLGTGLGLLTHYARGLGGDAAPRVDMPGPVIPTSPSEP